MNSLVLYTNSQFSSPYVLSVYATLVEKGLPFELKAVDLNRGEQFSKDYAQLSLTSRVPTLVDGDFSLSESSAIIEYLEEAYPRPAYASVFPEDAKPRARARQIQAWLRSDLGALREERPTTVIYAAKNPKPLSSQAQQAAQKLLTIADMLIGAEGQPLFGQWSIADVDMAVTLNRLVANGDPTPEKIRRYVAQQSSRPCVADWWKRAAQAR
ncbi:glutathione transferase [Paralcaligenes ureilyticus]|uniref:Glutathione S-transferase n=1 Tax=Paralcaligenes ureilyticus TaxID=627131 RepID=A0A4R3LYJ2_9BURK|nr:glutathione transferase [Paralcaligenes ureilyticus]TCT05722.1 glutathione S-transferase [Paralcaligenes ureilyticus]